MISSNRGTWSSHDASYNNCLKPFSFYKNDKVICEYIPSMEAIKFTKYKTKAEYILPIKFAQDEDFYPCVVFVYPEDKVEFELLTMRPLLDTDPKKQEENYEEF